MTGIPRWLPAPLLTSGLVAAGLVLAGPAWETAPAGYSVVRGEVSGLKGGSSPDALLGQYHATATTDTNQTAILLGIGAEPSERRISWLTETEVEETVQLAPGDHTTMPADAVVIQTSERGQSADPDRDYAHATLTDLSAGTYSYRVGSDAGGWSDINEFEVYPQDIEHTFTFVTDPQLGASGSVEQDGEGWQRALDANDRLFPDSQFLLSGGDQVDTYSGNLNEYRAYLGPEQVRTYAFAHTLGNHDYDRSAQQELFIQHFNRSNLAAYDPTGGSYWFIYNDVLHLNISTEHHNWDDHRTFLETTIAEHGDDAHWTMLTFHQSLYGAADHSTGDTINEIRDGLAPIINDLDIDLVLTGHDHAYSRSFLIDAEGNQVDPTTSEVIVDADGQIVARPKAFEGDDVNLSYEGRDSSPRLEDGAHVRLTPHEGETLFITANSASGSKHYDLRDVSEYREGFQPRFRDQQHEQNITGVEVDQCSLTTSTVELDGTVVDKVELLRDRNAPEIIAANSTIAVGSDFDPLAGVEVTDDCATLSTEAVDVEGQVDTANAGEYTLTYRVSDDAGNETAVERIIAVTE